MEKLKNISKVMVSARIVFFTAISVLLFSQAHAQQGSGVVLPQNTGLPNPQGGFEAILTGLVNWLLVIFGLLALISFIVSGILYLTAAGDEDQQKKAKRAMYYSITGVIVGLSGFLVIKAVDTWLRGTSASF